MAKLLIVDREGRELAVEASEDLSVMEIIRDSGVDELLAMCGGCCSCATCHVYVDEVAFAQLPAVSEDENDLLDSSAHRSALSRLACQVRFAKKLDNMKVTIAPED